MNRIKKITVLHLLIATAFSFFYAGAAQAGLWEISTGVSYRKSNYDAVSFSTTRTWGFSVSYRLYSLSNVEFSFENVVSRTKLGSVQDTQNKDQVYSANWVQSIMPKTSPIQPFVKLGVGQLNRKVTGHTNGIPPSVDEVNRLTVVLGVGLRIFMTQRFAIRMDGTSYLDGGDFGTLGDNFALKFGTSFFF